MKKILSIIALISIIFTTNSCDKYLDVNKNEDAPDHIDAILYLPGIQSAYQEVYYDIRAVGPLTQMMGTSSYTNFANHYYNASSDAAGQVWRMTYWTQGYNLENMINQSIEQEAWTLAGMGLAMKAYSWDMTTKYHGEMPMKQAYVPGILSHNYDYQEEIFAQVREWAKTAIEYLEREDKFTYNPSLKTNDLIYKGDKSKWIKFAHGVIVRNLTALTNKTDFVSKYADELISHAQLALQTTADDAGVMTLGGGADAQFSSYNNFWGAYRGNLSNVYWQHDYAVQVFTGTVPKYDESTGDKLRVQDNSYRPYELADKQIICDTFVKIPGHYDPRVIAKLSTTSDPYYKNIGDKDSVVMNKYYGASFTSSSGPIGTAPSYFGRIANSSTTYDGEGRWLYRNNAPYILMTAAEMKFCLAEAYWKTNKKDLAFQAWKEGVKLDLEFTANYLDPGSYAGLNASGKEVTGGKKPGGDKITKALFNQFAAEYAAGPYVEALPMSEFSLSHIMMQKWVALYPWGAHEAWVDMRKYQYDIQYTGEYPSLENGWEKTVVYQKWDSDPTKVYKGFYLKPANVENRRSAYNTKNEGSPCYRIRPRYNSEYMWNKTSLKALKPISGFADNYHCSIPWFAYPGDYPIQ